MIYNKILFFKVILIYFTTTLHANPSLHNNNKLLVNESFFFNQVPELKKLSEWSLKSCHCPQNRSYDAFIKDCSQQFSDWDPPKHIMPIKPKGFDAF